MGRSILPTLFKVAWKFTVFTMVASRAYAAGIAVAPSLTFTESWDSNIFNTTANEESDYIFRAYPALRFTLFGYGSALVLGGGLEVIRYANHPELNDTSSALTTHFDITMDRSKPLQITPRFSLTPSFRFAQTYDSVKMTQLTREPISGLPPPQSYITTTKTGLRQYGGDLTAAYWVTPKVTVEIGGGGYRQVYLNAAPETVDSTLYAAHLRGTYQFTQRFSTGIKFEANDTRYDNGGDTITYTAALGGTYRLADEYTLTTEIGATSYEENTRNQGSNNPDWAPYLNVTLSYNRQYFYASLLASYQISGGGGFGTTRRGYLFLDLNDRITDRWSYFINANFQRNRTISGTEQDWIVGYGSLGIQYSPVYWIGIQLSGQTAKQWDLINSNNDIDKRSVLLGVSIGRVYGIATGIDVLPELQLPF